jgi:hypothetical protein
MDGHWLGLLNLELHKNNYKQNMILIELSVKSSEESTEAVNLLKTGNKVVEAG